MKLGKIFGAALVGVLASASAQAATVTYAGSLIDFGSGWRTSVPAQFAIGGTSILGVDGYYLPGAGGNGSLCTGCVLAQKIPAYVSAATGAGAYSGNNGYAYIDNPTTTPGATPTLLRTGTFTPYGSGPNQTFTDFTFTVGANAPHTIQIGVLEDNLDIAAYNGYALQVTGPGGAASSVVSLTAGNQNNRNPDWYFFTIVGAQSGDVYSLVSTSGQNTTADIGGVSFDSAVPEPATWTMMLVGLGGMGAMLRSRRRMAVASA